MRRKITFVLALCMIVTLCAVGNPTVYADGWKLPEGTRIYKPGRTMTLDFGTLTILDVGFAKKAQSIIQVNTTTKTVNGVSETTENHRAGYRTAKDGRVLFAFKGLLYNSSDQSITLERLNPTIRFSEEAPTIMYGYPAVPFGRDEYYSLEPDQDVEIVFACTAPNEMYYGSGDILLEFAGGTFGFERADLGNYNSIGFTPEDGEEAGDLTEVPAVQEEGVIVANQPHVDEVQAEDVSLEYDSGKDAYRVHVKLRNLAGYPLIHEKYPDIVTVHVQFIDSARDVLLNGDFSIMSIGAVSGGYTDLSKGQAGWDNSYQFVSKSVLDQAEWICIPSYSFSYIGINSDGSTQDIDGTFTEPLTLAISNILPEKKSTSKEALSRIGETVSTDVVEFTLTNVTYGNTLSLDKGDGYYLPTTAFSGLGAGDNNTFVVFDFAVKNISKSKISGTDICGMDSKNHSQLYKINYSDGYLYDWGNYADLHLASIAGIYNYNPSVDPLKTVYFRANIKCVDLIETDVEAPLLLEISLPSSNGRQDFTYVLR